MSYLDTTVDVYKNAALIPDVGLCCTTTPVWQLPGLHIPSRMLEMNYGCGSTVHPRDLVRNPKVLYVGVGGGMELLQFAYFSRSKASVIGVDVVEEMLKSCQENLIEAQKQNDWFSKDFVDLKYGSALKLPLEDESVDVAAQNCLFNIFKIEDLKKALSEMYRVLKPHGRLILSDPICESPMPANLREDASLRALCLSGAMPLQDYLKVITDIGFGTVEVRAKGRTGSLILELMIQKICSYWSLWKFVPSKIQCLKMELAYLPEEQLSIMEQMKYLMMVKGTA